MSTTLSHLLLVSLIYDRETRSGNLRRRREGRLSWRDNSSDRPRRRARPAGVHETEILSRRSAMQVFLILYAYRIACNYFPDTNENIISDKHHNINLHHSGTGLI